MWNSSWLDLTLRKYINVRFLAFRLGQQKRMPLRHFFWVQVIFWRLISSLKILTLIFHRILSIIIQWKVRYFWIIGYLISCVVDTRSKFVCLSWWIWTTRKNNYGRHGLWTSLNLQWWHLKLPQQYSLDAPWHLHQTIKP